MNEWPAEGGSYVRNPDGSLTKVIETDNQTAETPAAAGETDNADAVENGDAGETTRKVK